MRVPETFGALRERAFRPLYYAQVTSVIGDNIAPIALAFAVLEVTGSPSDVGLVLAARTLPIVVFVVPAGVLADRFGRRPLMIASDLVCLATQGAVALLLVVGSAQMTHLIVLQALFGAATAFFLPASTGLVPQTVSAPRLQQANALIFLSIGIGGIVGPAIAGVLVATVGPGWAIAVDAMTFAASAAFLLRLRVPGHARPSRAESFLAQLVEGWREVRSRTWVWASILNFGLFQLLVLGSFYVLGPVVSERSLGGAPSWALVVGALGLGSVVGSALALRIQPRRPLAAAFLASFLFAPAVTLLALAAPLVAIALAWTAAGAAMGFGGVLWETTLQEKIPGEARSRVSAYDWMGSLALRPLGFAVAGPIAAFAGVTVTMLMAAAAFVAVTLATVSLRTVRTLERTAEVAVPGRPTPSLPIEALRGQTQ